MRRRLPLYLVALAGLVTVAAGAGPVLAWTPDTQVAIAKHGTTLAPIDLHNQLATNRFQLGGRTISLADIRVPLFVLGTETDHVAPWHSVYKIHQLTQAELTFALTSGGHNAGVVSGPEHPRRRHRVHTRKPGDKYRDPESWMEEAEVQAGSWWPMWDRWLDAHTSAQVEPPAMGAPRKGLKPLRDAPGEYVFA